MLGNVQLKQLWSVDKIRDFVGFDKVAWSAMPCCLSDLNRLVTQRLLSVTRVSLVFAWLMGLSVSASPLLDSATPTEFFTNVASRLLRAELGQDLNRIQVYPTNQYTPEVHRLLQVSANLYDCTTNRSEFGRPYFPSVFRPMFTNDSGNFYICGYLEEPGIDLVNAPIRDLTDPAQREIMEPMDMALGIPVVIGARKGFPSFNEIAMQTAIRFHRKLEFRRNPATGRVNETNQMLMVGITNTHGLEAWNSYSNVYPRPVRVHTQTRIRFELTNGVKTLLSKDFTARDDRTLAANTWPGYINPNLAGYSFCVPIDPRTNVQALLPMSTYLQTSQVLTQLSGTFERGAGFESPNWGCTIQAEVSFSMIDVAAGRIVDYVNLTKTNGYQDLAGILQHGGVYQPEARYRPDASPGSVWATNRSSSSFMTPTFGVLNQVMVGMGGVTVTESQWRNFAPSVTSNFPREALQRQFEDQLLRTDVNGASVFYAPFDPFRTIYFNMNWQANDPFVHYTVADAVVPSNSQVELYFSLFSPTDSIGKVNRRYEPWTYLTASGSTSPTRFDVSLKDPLISRSDDWDFPEAQPLSPEWIGRVHRGTPWMTINLKSTRTDPLRWREWMPGWNSQDILLADPSSDRLLVDLLAPLLNTNPPSALARLNQPDSEAWQTVLHGLPVLTNILADEQFIENPLLAASYEQLTIDSNSSPASLVGSALEQLQANQPTHHLTRLSDLLAEPAISLASPWLHMTSRQALRGINDAAYEMIPSGLLGRLWPDSVGTAIPVQGSQPQFEFSGVDGYDYRIECSTNLTDWVPISTNYSDGLNVHFIRPPASASGMYFRSSLVNP